MEPSPNHRQGGSSFIKHLPLILLGSKEGGASTSRKGGNSRTTEQVKPLAVPAASWTVANRYRRSEDTRMQAGIKHSRETI